MRWLALSILTLVCSVGCYKTCEIVSTPSGATVYLDDKPMGQTPIEVKFNKSEFVQSYDLRVVAPGYAEYKKHVERDSNFFGGSSWPERIVVQLKRLGEP